MVIRKAKPEEFKIIVSHILLAMDELMYHFTGGDSKEGAIQLLEKLARGKGNQYSYENCWVAEDENGIAGSVIVYDGAKLHQLKETVIREIKSMFNIDFHLEDETQAGEYYIDSIGVNPNRQGQGIGSTIFQFLINEYVFNRKETLGLLVDKDNPKAKKLYLNLGFEKVGEKTLAGKCMEHLQYRTGNKNYLK
ncbi:GNAT family N-acetyltransferase [Olivibacter ginsenosidimutans]|uniref:GNAT family N-acetyltransferase n=1 Tax=Olivibacter ginsenosidimutans TaxID=1176537 RepID=A0ABP9ADG3_9SPHI